MIPEDYKDYDEEIKDKINNNNRSISSLSAILSPIRK
jgi:hypothetical protein